MVCCVLNEQSNLVLKKKNIVLKSHQCMKRKWLNFFNQLPKNGHLFNERDFSEITKGSDVSALITALDFDIFSIWVCALGNLHQSDQLTCCTIGFHQDT